MKRLEDQPKKWELVTSATMNEYTASIFKNLENATFAVEVFEIDEVTSCMKKLSAEDAMKEFGKRIQEVWE